MHARHAACLRRAEEAERRAQAHEEAGARRERLLGEETARRQAAERRLEVACLLVYGAVSTQTDELIPTPCCCLLSAVWPVIVGRR